MTVPIAKKHLGQNFLKNKEILNKIVGEESLSNFHIVEVWPGPGDLTAEILSHKPSSLTLIEIDRDMIPLLERRFGAETIDIYIADVLSVDIREGRKTVSKKTGCSLSEKEKNIILPSYNLYGNIPYYITSPIIHHFFYEVSFLPQKAVFTMQKEVADRIMARDGKHSTLSISCQLVATIKKVCDISPNNFIPVPKVWSTCLEFTIKSSLSKEKRKKIMRIVEQWFSQKRKKLISNLQNLYKKEDLESVFSSLNIPENTRAEDLSIEEWISMADLLS